MLSNIRIHEDSEQLPATQNELFYNLNFEQRILCNHLLRKIDPFFDFEQIRSLLHPFYSFINRPSSIESELMIRQE